MRVTIINLTDFNQSVDSKGKGDAMDSLHVGPRGRSDIDIDNEEKRLELERKYKGVFQIRKASLAAAYTPAPIVTLEIPKDNPILRGRIVGG